MTNDSTLIEHHLPYQVVNALKPKWWQFWSRNKYRHLAITIEGPIKIYYVDGYFVYREDL